MSFSWDIKKKLCAIEFNCPFCVRSETAGIVGFSGEFTDERLKLMTEHNLLAKRIVDDLKNGIGYEAEITDSGKNKKIVIDDLAVLENLRSYLYIDDTMSEADFENEIVGLDCCCASYIRGAFLSGGCVLDPEKSYHLEFDTKYKKSAYRLKKVLEQKGYPVKITDRKCHYLVYIKEAEAIAEVLGIIGAGGGALAMYSTQLEKEIRNDVNRQMNCDVANTKKLMNASRRQISAINKIANSIGLEALPNNLKEIAELRLENPEISLKELGEMLSLPIGKSGVNHRLNKIIEISEEVN